MNLTPENESYLDYIFNMGRVIVGRVIKPVRVKYKGDYVYTTKGKTIWKTLGNAKNAVNNFLDEHRHEENNRWKDRYNSINLRKELEDAGHLTYHFLDE